MLDDDLITRLRAADPADADAGSIPSRAAVARRVRRRHVGRAGRFTLAGTVAAVCAVIAAPLGPSGTPALADVIARASDAATPAPGVITKIRTEVEWTAIGTEREVRTVWFRRGATGEELRMLQETDGIDEVSRDGRIRSYDQKTGATKELEGRTVASILFSAKAMLEAARRGDAKPKLAGQEVVGGRKVYRLTITGADDAPALPGDRDELLVDAETYAPVLLRKHSEGLDVHGKPFTYDLSERVLEHETLPDTAENRRLLELRGPTD
jgi:hypothetical protein